MTEQEIIYTALENLQNNAQIPGRWEPFLQGETDGYIVLNVGNKNVKFKVLFKQELRIHDLIPVMNRVRNDGNLMILAPRIFPKIKKELRYYGIAYLEGNGNIYLKNDQQLLWIDANPPLQIMKQTGNRAFTKTGLRVVFQFLLDETWINKPYREIAEYTDTGIGNLNNIITGLKQEGFLIPLNKNEYKLANKKELLLKWVTAYEQKLKPTLAVGKFRFLGADDYAKWRTILPFENINTHKTVWGGEPGGDILTNYLRPEIFTIYTTETRNELIKQYRLIPDEKGNVEVYKKFWTNDGADYNAETNYGMVAPPLLVYADLLNTNDRRCIETANKVYDEYLQTKL